jgi:RNA polymerase sigma-70 factor (ECF subfamily)
VDGIHEASHGTLAGVLYAKEGKTLIAEEQWAALVRAIAAGDEGALHALYERAHRPVYTLVVRMSANRETAEELTLDVFHDVWRRASSYDPSNGSVLGWIMNQARSRAIDRLRFEQRKKRVPPAAQDPTDVSETADPHDRLALKEQSHVLRDAVTSLTPDERQAIESAFFSQLTYAEVAHRYGVPLGTIKTRIRSALQKLKQRLASEAVR